MSSRLLLATVVTVLTVGTVEAQRPHRSGLWFEAGWGPSSIRVSCTGCEEITRASGSGVGIRVGGVISDRVLIGLESFTFLDETFGLAADDTSLVARTSNLGGVVIWYPGRSGFFLKGGVGIAQGEFTLQADTEEEEVFEGTGVGLTFGVGLDIPVKRWLAISLNAGAYVTAIGDLVLPTVRVDDVIPSMYALTVGFTIR
jgi:hypothetical protein